MVSYQTSGVLWWHENREAETVGNLLWLDRGRGLTPDPDPIVRLALVLLVVGCGPSSGADEVCTREDVVSSGALVSFGREECSPCNPETSAVLITLETTCEAGGEWGWGPYRLIHHTVAVNQETQERFEFENPFGAPAERLWRVDPGEPLEWPGPRTDLIVTEPGDYSFRVELLFDLMAAEFEGTIE